KVATVCSANPDIVSGWGLIDSHNTMYLPQSVIDNEMAAMVRRLRSEVEISTDTMAGASIAKVGPGGGYLAEKETARRIRAGEHLMPRVSTRLSYDKWVEEDQRENDVASHEVERLLAAHAAKEPCLTDAQLADLAHICRMDGESIRRARRE
ncbi:MAG TPA: trimethylamine methyltransferase family protein, partial [Thermoleophilia bacterium]|nr:trimethylamine methyltransferase family protein [Thermoleophilia bacterium]